MLTRLKLENFKSWRELDIELAPITLLFGTNSSGKTAILQSLLLLKQSVENFDRKQHINLGGGKRDYVDFGSYQDVVYLHQAEQHFGIRLEWNFSPILARNEFFIDLSWKKTPEDVVLDKLIIHNIDNIHDPITAEYLDDETYRFSTDDETVLGRPPLRYDVFSAVIPPLTKDETKPSNISSYVKASETSYQFAYFVRDLVYLGPIRQNPLRTYQWSGATPTLIEPDGENTISVLIDSQRNDKNLLEQVTRWLIRLGLVDELYIEPLDANGRFYEVKVKGGTKASSLLDVGFGVSQVLPVITMLFFVPEGSIVLIEQPELHLHPSAQAQLGDLLLHVAETRNLQLVIESHSEHLLRRLQRRIAEIDQPFASPENVKMYFCQRGEDGSQIQEVEVDRFGQILNWPDNFFGDILSDLDKMTDAALERRRKELTGD